MKKVILSLALIVGFTTTNAQTKEVPEAQQETKMPDATIDFESKVVDYGTIEHNSDGARKFVFTNNGTEPLIIKNAKGSCGCTVPEWPKSPILPGKEAYVKVVFNSAGKIGKQKKTVTLLTNAIPATKVLTVSCNVLEKKNKNFCIV